MVCDQPVMLAVDCESTLNCLTQQGRVVQFVVCFTTSP